MQPLELSGRLVSLDAFRGLTIAAMILVNNPGSWAHIYSPLDHAQWHGWTPTDLIFPFFLFIVGVSMTFSFPKRLAEGDGRQLHWTLLRRSLIIYALGLLLAAFPFFELGKLRYVGVLPRIALVYLVTGLIVLNCSRRTQVWIVAGLLLGYWAAMKLVPVPGIGPGILTPAGNLAAWIDGMLVPGRMYRGTWDPEGIFSTFPAVATALLGVFTGYWLRCGREGAQIARGMLAAGLAGIVTGLVWGMWFPVNKNLWTSSYVVFTAGAALLVLGICYWTIDIRGWRRWAQPAVVFGVNPIALFVLSGLVSRLLGVIHVPEAMGGISLKAWLHGGLFVSWLPPTNASLAFALAYVALWWAFAAWLYRRRIFIKV